MKKVILSMLVCINTICFAQKVNYGKEVYPLLKEGKYEEALPKLYQFLNQDPTHANANYWAGKVYSDKSAKESKAAFIDTAIIFYSKAYENLSILDLNMLNAPRFPDFGKGIEEAEVKLKNGKDWISNEIILLNQKRADLKAEEKKKQKALVTENEKKKTIENNRKASKEASMSKVKVEFEPYDKTLAQRFYDRINQIPDSCWDMSQVASPQMQALSLAFKDGYQELQPKLDSINKVQASQRKAESEKLKIENEKLAEEKLIEESKKMKITQDSIKALVKCKECPLQLSQKFMSNYKSGNIVEICNMMTNGSLDESAAGKFARNIASWCKASSPATFSADLKKGYQEMSTKVKFYKTPFVVWVSSNAAKVYLGDIGTSKSLILKCILKNDKWIIDGESDGGSYQDRVAKKLFSPAY